MRVCDVLMAARLLGGFTVYTVFVNQWIIRSMFSRLRDGVFVPEVKASSFRGVEL